jgi:hypothetical protein
MVMECLRIDHYARAFVRREVFWGLWWHLYRWMSEVVGGLNKVPRVGLGGKVRCMLPPVAGAALASVA